MPDIHASPCLVGLDWSSFFGSLGRCSTSRKQSDPNEREHIVWMERAEGPGSRSRLLISDCQIYRSKWFLSLGRGMDSMPKRPQKKFSDTEWREEEA